VRSIRFGGKSHFGLHTLLLNYFDAFPFKPSDASHTPESRANEVAKARTGGFKELDALYSMQTPRKLAPGNLRGRRGTGTPGQANAAPRQSAFGAAAARGGSPSPFGGRDGSSVFGKRPTGVSLSKLASEGDNDAVRQLVEPVEPLSPIALTSRAGSSSAFGRAALANDVQEPEDHGAGDDDAAGFAATLNPPVNATGITSFMRSEGGQGRGDRFTSDVQQLYNALKAEREDLRREYIKQGKIADPDAKQQLADAIDLVGECEEMCPEFERVDREMSGTVDALEKVRAFFLESNLEDPVLNA